MKAKYIRERRKLSRLRGITLRQLVQEDIANFDYERIFLTQSPRATEAKPCKEGIQPPEKVNSDVQKISAESVQLNEESLRSSFV